MVFTLQVLGILVMLPLAVILQVNHPRGDLNTNQAIYNETPAAVENAYRMPELNNATAGSQTARTKNSVSL